MRYWWVNQNKSYTQEREGGYLWAPFVDARGGTRRHWDAMDEVEPNDLVFHYAGARVRAVSRVTDASVDQPRPSDLPTDAWESSGRMVQSVYEELLNPLPLSAIPLDIRKAQPSDGPFDVRGEVKVGYLFNLTPEFGRALLHLTSTTPPPESDITGDVRTASQVTAPWEGDLSTPRTTQERKEQPKLRRQLFGTKQQLTCNLCNGVFPRQFVWAAHIKRRSKCEEHEARDIPAIAFGACILGCDALYEYGYISVSDQGWVIGCQAPEPGLQPHIDSRVGNEVAVFGPANVAYFQWHRDHVFRGQAR